MVDRRGTVNAAVAGGPVISPEKLTVGRRDPDECFRGELYVLALPVEVDGDGRGVCRSGAAGHLALPDGLAGQLVEGHESRVFAAGGADDLITINEWRLAETPGWYFPAKLALEAALPNDLAVTSLKASQLAAQAENIEPFSIDRRRASRTIFLTATLAAGKPAQGALPKVSCHPSQK